MSLMVLSRYGRMGASSRLRTYQYLSYICKTKTDIQVFPFFDDEYLCRKYAGNCSKLTSIGSFIRRVSDVAQSRYAKAIWIEKEILPWLPWLIEKALLPKDVAIIVDYDDAIFHRYDLHRSAIVRRVLGRKIDRLMARATLVVAGNAYLANRARRAGASWVEVVPTVVDITAYTVKRRAPREGLCIGWIGTPSTWREYMASMTSLLSEVAAAHDARVAAVGAGRAAAPDPVLDILPWSEETEVDRIQDMDIGIMPLNDTPWAQGKCGYKLIQYMACGLPVVASPVGVNAQIVKHGVNGFLATTETEWRNALKTLLCDAGLRERMGAAGRHEVEQKYSLQAWAPKVVSLLDDVMKRRAG